MWLDRSFVPNPESKRPGHIGELWMVHGGGFYHVEKLQMGPTKVPDRLHWFKWESYWTWMSGFFLVAMIFYTGDGTFLLDSAVSSITYKSAVGLSLFAIFGSWFFYDFLWESTLTKRAPLAGHLLTLAWLTGMAFLLCHTLSGRAAYLHVGAMMGTWMTANVFLRIIPRQVKMVQAAQRNEPLNPEWPKNAKNRSTHNTYLTLPVIFVMLSNHFPTTYGHPWNWAILLAVCAGGAAIREYFVVREKRPFRSKIFGLLGMALISAVIVLTREPVAEPVAPTDPRLVKVTVTPAKDGAYESTVATPAPLAPAPTANAPKAAVAAPAPTTGAMAETVRGTVDIEGAPPAPRKLSLPLACAKEYPNQTAYSNEVLVREGHLQNVLVRVTKGHENLPATAVPTAAVELDQRGCLYRPRLIAARVGQEVVFINSDPVFHNVRSYATANENFNLAMPTQNQRIARRFTKPEIFLQAKCSVHPWMGAYVAVMDHPYFAVTNERGEFALPRLPAGRYTLEFWHEYYGTQTRDIEVTDRGAEVLRVTFKK